jgi:hypothetical protein
MSKVYQEAAYNQDGINKHIFMKSRIWNFTVRYLRNKKFTCKGRLRKRLLQCNIQRRDSNFDRDLKP